MALEINIQVNGVNIDRMREICSHFDLECSMIRGGIFNVRGKDPINFYWLGMNLANILNPVTTGITTTKSV